MIIDKLENLGKYVSLNPLFADVVDFLKDHDLNSMEVGKYPIKEKDLFLNLTTAKGRGKEAAVLETHIEMIDIQIPLSCEETFGYTPLEDLPQLAYNPEKDITKYSDKTDCFIMVKPMHFAIFWPWDGHQPCVGEGNWKKLVVKIKL